MKRFKLRILQIIIKGLKKSHLKFIEFSMNSQINYICRIDNPRFKFGSTLLLNFGCQGQLHMTDTMENLLKFSHI